VLSWSHAPYAPDAYTVRLDVQGGSSHTHTFLVGEGGVKVNDLVAFPNPFDDAGTAFSFTLVADGPTDILIRVFTTAGRLIYERTERGMLGGYHQLPWNGVDAEGSSIANGVYLYKLIAANNGGKVEELGRLVRLRKPHHNGS
jgi:flagellar hook assembly protein FlgD